MEVLTFPKPWAPLPHRGPLPQANTSDGADRADGSNKSAAPSCVQVASVGPLWFGAGEVEIGAEGATTGWDTVWEVHEGDSIGSIYEALVARGLGLDENAFRTCVRFNQPGIDLDAIPVGIELGFGACNPRAPTIGELLASPIVRRGIEEAWFDSKPDDLAARHEEGGWIYMNLRTGEVFIARAFTAGEHAIHLSVPIRFQDSVVVGTFHTHPDPRGQDYRFAPSDSDISMDQSRGIPAIVRAHDGYHVYGWERRESVNGSWAYPGTPERPLG